MLPGRPSGGRQAALILNHPLRIAMSTRAVDVEQEERKRAIRLRIGRLRRRIDGRLRAAERHGRRLLSWQTYVKQWPGSTVVAALGVGLAASTGLDHGRIGRWLGLRLVRGALNRARRQAWRELQQIWADSTPHRTRR